MARVATTRGGLHRIAYVRADYSDMRDLQLVARADLYDHAPVVGQVDVAVAHPSLPSRSPRVCTQRVMEALLAGERRDIFVSCLNEGLEGLGDAWRSSLGQSTVCEAWALLSGAVLEAGREVFSPAVSGSPEEDVCASHRLELLGRRAQLRRALGAEEDLASVQLELGLLGRRLRLLRHHRADHRRRLLLDELWTAWRLRRHHELHRVRGLLSGSGRAPRKRHLWAATRHAARSAEWSSLLCMPSAEGVLDAEVITSEGSEEAFLRDVQRLNVPLPVSAALVHAAEDDYYGMMLSMASSRKRKSVPDGGVPMELLLLAMAPLRRLPGALKSCIGYDGPIAPRPFREKRMEFLLRVRRLGWHPRAWHACKSVPLPKPGSAKFGPAAMRLIHIYHSAASAVSPLCHAMASYLGSWWVGSPLSRRCSSRAAGGVMAPPRLAPQRRPLAVRRPQRLRVLEAGSSCATS